MTKKRRTKREKMNSGLRKNNFDFVFKVPIEDKKEKAYGNSTAKQDSKDYTYILAESKNTLLITAIIVVANLFVFIALKQNYINLFGIDF